MTFYSAVYLFIEKVYIGVVGGVGVYTYMHLHGEECFHRNFWVSKTHTETQKAMPEPRHV